MNATFLEKLALEILEKHPDTIHKLCFVFPSKRSGLFFKKELAKHKNAAFWAPTILTIEEFVSQLSGVSIIGPLEQVFHLFQVHQDLKIQPQLPFEKFIEQGKVILGDFNDIDMALADANSLFHNVNDYVHLENWDPSQPSQNALSQKYIDSYKNLPLYYAAYKDLLLGQNKAYQGLVYRFLKDEISRSNSTTIQEKITVWDQVYVAGLNALTPAESWFFDWLKGQKKLQVYYEAEYQMVSDPDQESGTFMRMFQRSEKKNFKWVTDRLKDANKNISTYAVNGNLAIARLVGDFFRNNEKNGLAVESETAIILADENLLMPVLESIPPSVQNINVTLGFPLGLTPFMSVVEQLFAMHQLAKQWDGKKKFYFKDVLKLFSNSVLVRVFGNTQELALLTQNLVKTNQVWIDAEDLKEILLKSSNFELLAEAFTDWKNNPLTSIKFFNSLINQYQNELDQQQAADDVLLEQLYFFKTSLTTLQEYIDQFKYGLSLEAIRQIFKQVVSPLNVPFSGEPLAGVQIMGLLETRLLQFKNIIFLSVNEGVIPAKGGFQSFLPFVLRNGFNIQTYQERESLFAYHFYRILSQAENIKLVYNTSTEGVNGNEKSRFIRQIQQEWPQKSSSIEFKHHIGVFKSINTVEEDEKIEKSSEVLANIKNYLTNRGLSPSALNTYIESPIDFYYKNVLKIQEPKLVDEDVEHNTFGTIVHGCLETFYTPFENLVLKPSHLQEALSNIDAIIEEEFTKEIPDHSRGKHYLSFYSVNNYVKKFIHDDIAFIRKHKFPITLVKNELEIRCNLNVGDLEVKFLGFADRVERRQGILYISDYKTGLVKGSDVTVKFWDDFSEGKHKPKLMQLLMYAWMTNKVLNEPKIVSGIYSLRTSEGLLPAKVEGNEVLDSQNFEQVEEFIVSKITEMMNPDVALTRNPDYGFSVF